MVAQYERRYTVRADGLALVSPGMPDILWVPIGPAGPVRSVLAGARMSSSWTTDPPSDTFALRSTKPVCVDPLVPVGTDNVGWDGNSSGGTFTSLQTVAAGATRSNQVFNCDVNLTDANSTLNNCLIRGGVATTSRSGLVQAASGGQLNRCTISGTPSSIQYYRNGIKHSGGVLQTTRCVFDRVVDGIHSTGTSNRVISHGDLFKRFAFFDNDLDHSNPPNPYWTHNDSIQILSGPGPHEIIGSSIEGYFDTTSVVWSGGPWGSGTASGGYIGMPATALNGGYWNSFGQGNWSNGLSFTNASGFDTTIEDCWIDGCNAPSGMMQWTVGTTNVPRLKRNKFGLGGKPSGSGTIYLISYPTGTAAVIGSGADANVYGVFPSVAGGLQGTPLTFTGGGAKITGQ